MANGREALVVTAERLIAERGVQVPLRDIAIEAGQRNNSAVQYHFGSREDLIVAVIDHRAPTLEQHRLDRLVALEGGSRGDDPRALVAALVLPLLESPIVDHSWYYARFLEQVRVVPGLIDRATIGLSQRGSVGLILTRLARAMPSMPRAERDGRVRAFGTAVFALAADHERQLASGVVDEKTTALGVDVIIDALTAMLLAQPRRAASAS